MCESLELNHDDVMGSKSLYELARAVYINNYGMDIEILEELLSINYKEGSSIAVKMVVCKLTSDYLMSYNEVDDMLLAFYNKLKSMEQDGLPCKRINELVSINSVTTVNGNVYPKGLGQVINII